MSFEPVEKAAETLKELTDNQAVRVGAETVKSSFVGAFWANTAATIFPFAPLPVTALLGAAVTGRYLYKKLKKEGLID